MRYIPVFLSSVYGGGSYDASTYQNGTTATTSPSTGTSSGSSLANTGFDLLLAATLGSVIIFTALIIRFWKKPSSQKD